MRKINLLETVYRMMIVYAYIKAIYAQVEVTRANRAALPNLRFHVFMWNTCFAFFANNKYSHNEIMAGQGCQTQMKNGHLLSVVTAELSHKFMQIWTPRTGNDNWAVVAGFKIGGKWYWTDVYDTSVDMVPIDPAFLASPFMTIGFATEGNSQDMVIGDSHAVGLNYTNWEDTILNVPIHDVACMFRNKEQYFHRHNCTASTNHVLKIVQTKTDSHFDCLHACVASHLCRSVTYYRFIGICKLHPYVREDWHEIALETDCNAEFHSMTNQGRSSYD